MAEQQVDKANIFSEATAADEAQRRLRERGAEKLGGTRLADMPHGDKGPVPEPDAP